MDISHRISNKLSNNYGIFYPIAIIKYPTDTQQNIRSGKNSIPYYSIEHPTKHPIRIFFYLILPDILTNIYSILSMARFIFASIISIKFWSIIWDGACRQVYPRVLFSPGGLPGPAFEKRDITTHLSERPLTDLHV